MAIKLQNNFTTPEQGKKLLELGVPRYSADCFYDGWNYIHHRDSIYNECMFFETHPECIPCWSVGRLIEICKECEPKKDYEQLCDEMMCCSDFCVLIISHIIANLPIIDFSKLED